MNFYARGDGINVPTYFIDDFLVDYTAPVSSQGCNDPLACNYSPFDQGIANCVFPNEFYDCDGCFNDTDGDGVCDELEVLGCTDNGLQLQHQCYGRRRFMRLRQFVQLMHAFIPDTPEECISFDIEVDSFDSDSIEDAQTQIDALPSTWSTHTWGI